MAFPSCFKPSSTCARRRGIITKVATSPTGVLLTTYDQLRIHRDMLLPVSRVRRALWPVWRP